MAKKFDGVVVGVHFAADGQVAWVRAYERRGPTFTDRVLIKRQDFINRLKAGKKFVVGERIPYQASTFNVTDIVQVVQHNGQDILITGGAKAEVDDLAGVPVL